MTNQSHKISYIIASLAICISVLFFANYADAKYGQDNSPKTIEHNGIERSYIIRGSTRPNAPLVIVLHGGAGNAKHAEQATGFTKKANKEGFLVAYPNGTGRFDKFLTWNANHCCGYAMKQNIDDVGFISAMIDRIAADYNIDTKRVYVTGISNGGGMAHRLGIELSHKITAIAPVSASIFGDEPSPKNRVSAIFINGALDDRVLMNGGLSGKNSKARDGTPPLAVIEQANFWAKANGCNLRPNQSSFNSQVTLQNYSCNGAIEVKHYLVKDGGHSWPGGKRTYRRAEKPSDSLNATDLIWDFFKNKSKY